MTRHKQVSSYSALRLYAKLYNEYNKEVNRIFEETKNGNIVALDIDFARELKELLEGAKKHALSFFSYASKLSGIENKSENYKNIINKATAKARELYHTLSKLDLSRIQATSENFKEEKEQNLS